tara:strand:- start:17 stop:223 length:207 start_codon:yes stop_codon:yes gene_type:complete
MVSYKERKENTRLYILLESDTVLGAFGNLKALCDFMEGKEFPSYWTLTRKKEDRIDVKGYSIQRVKIY